MGHRIVIANDTDITRTNRAMELAPPDLDVGAVGSDLSPEERASALADCEVLVCPGSGFNDADLERLPKLRVIQLMSAGFDRLDVRTIRERGIRVANNSAAIANSVAEHTVLLMLMVYRRAAQCVDGPREGVWQQKAKTGPYGRLYELTGRTVGIVGLGHIGSYVAARLKGFETTTLYHDVRDISPETESDLAVQRASFDELLDRSHVVTAHVPLNSQTQGMFGAAEFAAMREDAIFINTCRGPVHDEAALIDVLNRGTIWAAGLDVTETEPLPLESPLLSMDNVVVTPHAAGSSQERVDRALVFAFENARRVVSGDDPESLVALQD